MFQVISPKYIYRGVVPSSLSIFPIPLFVQLDTSHPTVMNRSTRPRQAPVSCQLCRIKKLKCDRQYPCSNCSSRRVDCQPATRPAAQPQRIKHPLSSDIQNASVLARLQKLEDAVFGMQDRPLFPMPPSQEEQSPTTVVATSPSSNNINEQHKTASKWLEQIGTREDSFVSTLMSLDIYF